MKLSQLTVQFFYVILTKQASDQSASQMVNAWTTENRLKQAIA
ncbi:hypothetical protein [Anabaena sp. CCY 0017]